jgi:hypothetical protein
MSMAGFSSATLERIRAASDIVDVIGACLPLTELPTPNCSELPLKPLSCPEPLRNGIAVFARRC